MTCLCFKSGELNDFLGLNLMSFGTSITKLFQVDPCVKGVGSWVCFDTKYFSVCLLTVVLVFSPNGLSGGDNVNFCFQIS